MNIMSTNQKSKTYIILIIFLLFFPTISLAGYCKAENSETQDYPLRRYGHKMLYLPEDESMFLFGGEYEYEGDVFLNNTWKYNYSSNTWQILSTTKSPSPRLNQGMVYDSKNQQIILFGGLDTNTYNQLNDTWIFDLNENQWEQLNLSNSPAIRSDMSFYYDDVVEALIIFGGYTIYNQLLNDTWCFYTQNNTWVEVNATNSPIARYGHHMVYDPVNQVGLMFGGHNFYKFDEMWQLNTSNFEWKVLNPTNKPKARYWHNMVYNEDEEQVTIIGGRNDPYREYLTNIWNFDIHLEEWEEIQIDVNPPRRELSSMVYHAQSKVIVLFGGLEGFEFDSLSDLWVYDVENRSWREIKPSILNNWIFWLILFTGVGILGSISYIIIRKKKK
jgi:N-acetylneuraminic acid mutarotase